MANLVSISFYVWLIIWATAQSLCAQPALTHAQPSAISTSGTTRVTLHGDKFTPPLRLWTSLPAVTSIVETTPQKLTVDITPSTPSLSDPSFGIAVATSEGASLPIPLLVDDLPSAVELADNHSPGLAQTIGLAMAVDATSDGKLADYFRFHAAAGQSITFEIVAQALDSAFDPVARLIDPSGHAIAIEDDDEISPDCRFRHRFERTGVHALVIQDNRFVAGGRYRLRVGEFPLIRFPHPSVVQRGSKVSLLFAGFDQSVTPHRTIDVVPDLPNEWMAVRASFQDRGSTTPLVIRMSDQPQLVEQEPNDTSETANRLQQARGINGLLEQPGDRDFYIIDGIKDQTWRFSARTRSLGSPSMLKMTLRNQAGEVLGRTAVNDTDEWQLDAKFPADAAYVLEVEDLLHRGGPGHGYHIDVGIAAPFSLAVKPDAKTREHLPIQTTNGAAAVDVTVQRNWNKGPIELRIEPSLPGLQLLHATVPADAKEHRVYLLATRDWDAQLFKSIRVIGRATQDPQGEATLSTAALLTQRVAHVPYPRMWSDGHLALVGVQDQPAFFEVPSPAEPVDLPNMSTDGTIELTVKRLNAEFKEPVAIVASELPKGWTASTKIDKDAIRVALQRPANTPASTEPPASASDQADQSHAKLQFTWYGMFQGRGQTATTSVDVRLVDPLKVAVAPPAAIEAGKTQVLSVELKRSGGVPQPVLLKLANLPAGITAPETTTVPPADSKTEIALTAADDAAAGKFGGIRVQATTKLGDREISVTSGPVELEVVSP